MYRYLARIQWRTNIYSADLSPCNKTRQIRKRNKTVSCEIR